MKVHQKEGNKHLQTKKYMGECRFLFFTIAVMTRMFSSREMIPRIRKTWNEASRGEREEMISIREIIIRYKDAVRHTSMAMWSCSQAAALLLGSSGGGSVKFA